MGGLKVTELEKELLAALKLALEGLIGYADDARGLWPSETYMGPIEAAIAKAEANETKEKAG